MEDVLVITVELHDLGFGAILLQTDAAARGDLVHQLSLRVHIGEGAVTKDEVLLLLVVLVGE